jgi:hypothetical protein
MRRAFATLLVLVFSLPLIAPALTSGSDASQLPACCRRSGRHQCALKVELGNIPTRIHVVSEKCPYSPFAHTPLVQPHPFAAPVSLTATNYGADFTAVIRAAEAGYRISSDRARHKRGPPLNLAL